MGDLDLPARRLIVRQGKGQQDRTVYLATAAVQALTAYLAVRGLGSSAHVLLYHHGPLHKDLLRDRIRAAGQRVGVPVTPHQLRHTYATQLLNAGCPVTTIQRLLGHRRLNSTLIYARVHDRTVADDYYTAMAHLERRLELAAEAAPPAPTASETDRAPWLALLDQLAAPQLEASARQALLAQLRAALTHTASPAPLDTATRPHDTMSALARRIGLRRSAT